MKAFRLLARWPSAKWWPRCRPAPRVSSPVFSSYCLQCEVPGPGGDLTVVVVLDHAASIADHVNLVLIWKKNETGGGSAGVAAETPRVQRARELKRQGRSKNETKTRKQKGSVLVGLCQKASSLVALWHSHGTQASEDVSEDGCPHRPPNDLVAAVRQTLVWSISAC